MSTSKLLYYVPFKPHSANKSASPTNKDRNFLTLLEPTSSSSRSGNFPEPSKISRATKSYDFSKASSSKTKKTQENPVRFSSAITRAKVNLSKDFTLREKLTNKTIDPKLLYKKHAVQLTKESVIKKYANNTTENIIKDIQEPLSVIKSILNWIIDQNDDVTLKMIRNNIENALQHMKIVSVEIEARLDVLTSAWEAKIKALEDQACENVLKVECQQKDLVKSLIEKNFQISNELCSYEKKICEQELIINKLKVEAQNQVVMFCCEETAESKEVSGKNSNADKEEVFSNIKNIENEFNTMRSIIDSLDADNKSKDMQIKKYLTQIESLNRKVVDFGKCRPVRKFAHRGQILTQTKIRDEKQMIII